MFEGSGRLDAQGTFPALAEAIAAIPVRPDRDGGSAAAEEARALLLLRRQLDARLLCRVAAVDEQGLAAEDGFASTSAWVRAIGNFDAGQAGGLVAAARVAERLPVLGTVLAQGKVGVEHLQAVARSTARVPQEELVRSDRTLANLAPHARPSDMGRAALAIQARFDEAAVARDAGYLHDSRRVTLARTFGNAYHLEGLLEPEAGAALAAALEPLMTRRDEADDRTPGQRRADALLELTGIALRSAALPDCGGDRPRLTFLIRQGAAVPEGADAEGAADPAAALHAVAQMAAVGICAFEGDSDRLLIGTTAMVPAQTISRIACDADVNVATVNLLGEVLNFSRSRRDPSTAQRRSLVLRDQGCVFPGCDRPPSLCQAHHLVPWSRGGPTDLGNLALICSFHHHLVHEGGWGLSRLEPGTRDNPQTCLAWLATAADGRQLREHRQPAA